MNAIIYTRVSTDQQSLGIEAQLASCTEYAKKKKYTISHIFTDEDVSGSLHFEERPSLKQAIDIIKKGDILLVSNRDRLGRSTMVIARIEYEIEKKKAKIISVAGEGTEDDNLIMMRMVDMFSEYERKRIRERIIKAMDEKRKKGEVIGRPPIGYKVNGVHLEKNTEETKLIRLIKRLHRKGMSMRKIAQYLNTQNILNKGHLWNHCAILRRLS